jgi:hypothetical protein
MQRMVGLTESWKVTFSFPLGLEPQLINGNEELMLTATLNKEMGYDSVLG